MPPARYPVKRLEISKEYRDLRAYRAELPHSFRAAAAQRVVALIRAVAI
jgi:hypothetical protein